MVEVIKPNATFTKIISGIFPAMELMNGIEPSTPLKLFHLEPHQHGLNLSKCWLCLYSYTQYTLNEYVKCYQQVNDVK